MSDLSTCICGGRVRRSALPLGLRFVADLSGVRSLALGIVLCSEPLQVLVPKEICEATPYLEPYRAYTKATASLPIRGEAVALFLGGYGLGI